MLPGGAQGPLLVKSGDVSPSFDPTSILVGIDSLVDVDTGSLAVCKSSTEGEGGGNLSVNELPSSEGVRRSPG